jgi:LysM repeat protein
LGLFQDPEFWQGLKSAKSVLTDKILEAGSNISLVKIRRSLANYKVLLVLPMFFVPILAYAGVFSFIASMFTETVSAEEEDVPHPNLQNMAILQSTNSPGSFSTTSQDTNIIEGNSLSKETIVAGDDKSSDSDLISLYVVHEGDTLPAIAKMFQVSANTIKWANEINGNKLTVGQTLVILPITGIKHVVKSGDTIQSIAKLHKGDIDEIMQYNNLVKGQKLVVGDIVIVPDGEAPAVTSSTKYSGGSSPTYAGYYMRPIIGGVKTQGVHGHNGVDLASSYGSNILAAADGEVIIARTGWNGGYGTYIVIKHGNGTQTLYGHLSGLNVSPGQTVKQGHVIGYMGNSGSVKGKTGIHLHFEVRGARNPF